MPPRIPIRVKPGSIRGKRPGRQPCGNGVALVSRSSGRSLARSGDNTGGQPEKRRVTRRAGGPAKHNLPDQALPVTVPALKPTSGRLGFTQQSEIDPRPFTEKLEPLLLLAVYK